MANIPFANDERPYQLLGYCAKLLNGPQLNRELAEVYFRAVGCNDAQAVTAALMGWLRSQRQFPAPVDLRTVIRKISGGEVSYA